MRIFLLSAVLLCLLSSCADPSKTAQNKLREQGYLFTADEFVSAAASGDIPTLVLFGKGGIDVNVASSKGDTALIAAAESGQLQAVDMLLGAGADPRIVNSRGRDALIATSAGGHTEIGRLLLSRGAQPTIRDSAGWVALSLAAFHGKSDMVRLLAAMAPKKYLDEALLLGSHNGDKATVSNLLSQGANVEAKGPDGETPLMIAAKKGNLEVVTLLLQNKANRFATDKAGKTPAQFAATGGFQNIIQLIKDGKPVPGKEKISASPEAKKTVVASGTEKPLVALNGSKIRTGNSSVNALTHFTLVDYREKKLPVALKSVDGIYASLIRLDPTGIPAEVKVAKGDIIPGTSYRLDEVEPERVRSNGLPENTIDTARVRIRNVKSGENHLLVLDEGDKPIDSWAVLSSKASNYRYVAKTGDIFQTIDPAHGERDYQVIAVRNDNIAVKELASAKILQVGKSRNL